MTFRAGDNLLVDVIKGKYRIIREIARSNDIVYEALDTTLGRRLALKELNIAASLTGQPRRERIERFNREARAAGKLNHPNIVFVSDYFEENGRYFIAMEYLEGQTLRDMMQVRGAFPLREAMDIACQVLDALAYAHLHRVIHRDIKPDNIHILPGGQAKLADFGIARLSEEPALTSDGQVFGTPSYMSPEQIEGRSIDARADLFSMGVLLYEMLSGRKPFVGDSVISITYAVMNADPPLLTGVPTGIEQVIRRALAKNPNGRPMSAEQMKTELRNAEQNPASFSPRPAPQPTLGRTGMGLAAGMQAYPMPSGGGYGANIPTGPNTNYGGYSMNPAQMVPASSPPAANSNGLPWAWNTTGAQTATPAPPAPAYSAPYGATPVPAGGPLTGAGGVYPYAAPPYPVRPAEPLFVLSPGGRTFLLSLLVAALIGGGIAGAVIGLQKSYYNYQQNVNGQLVNVQMKKGADAYNAGRYREAADAFEQALAAKPPVSLRTNLSKNLAYAYVQLARAAKQDGDKSAARDLYRKAIEINPDYDAAHTELAALLEQQGKTKEAGEQRNAVTSGNSGDTTPKRLDDSIPVSNSSYSSPSQRQVDPNQFMNDRRQQALQSIQEGDGLLRQGNQEGARDRWQQAISLAPGTPESQQATQRLQQIQPSSPDFGGY